MFEAALAVTAFLAGAVASIAGFGIGSFLTPLLVLKTDTQTTVAAVSIAHLVGTFLRFVKLRAYVDRRAFVHFGVLSAAGGLTGALLHSYLTSAKLSLVLGAVLMLAGFLGLSGLTEKTRIRSNWLSWTAGAVSGLFGGLVGNQGGIRSAALLSFDLSKQSYIATATAVALVVDLFRMPVYFVIEGQNLQSLFFWIGLMTAGVIAGTLAGTRLLSWIPERVFKRLVSALIFCLGIFVLLPFFS